MSIGVIEKLQAQVWELQAKVERLENGKVFETVSQKSQQERRDDIVENAKKDIDALKKGYYYFHHGYGNLKAEFIVNKKKRTVVTLLKLAHVSGNPPVFKGIAKCMPGDCFNVHIGKAIALRRALELEVPSEYFNAPKPTEVRIGDIIKRVDALGYEYVREVVKISDGEFRYFEGGWDPIDGYGPNIVVDDSRDEVSG